MVDLCERKMKFGKKVKKQVEESLREWRDNFVAYKRLKRLVWAGESSTLRAAAEVAFVRMLEGEIDRFNAFFKSWSRSWSSGTGYMSMSLFSTAV
jgi:SPX domain protein involved in polyphosphate accumulation